MSARFYPRYVKGNPQLRIFLPDWKMIMVKPKTKLPDNIVTFKVDPRMTDWDVKNYLEKIYKVQVGGIVSKIQSGEFKAIKSGLAKGYDVKIVNVTLPIGQTFKWPDIFPADKLEQEITDYKITIKEINKGREVNGDKPSAPSWFM